MNWIETVFKATGLLAASCMFVATFVIALLKFIEFLFDWVEEMRKRKNDGDRE